MAEKLKHYEDGFTTTTEKDGGREQEAVVNTEPGEVHSPEILAKDVKEIVEEADRKQDQHLLDNYYDKDEMDELYYDKTETNALLEGKQDVIDGDVEAGTVASMLGLDSEGNLVKGSVPSGSVVDSELDIDSTNPVENKAIAQGFADVENGTRVAGKSLTAEQLENVSEESGTVQDEPFIFQATGCDGGLGSTDTAPVAKQLELRGKTYALNQLISDNFDTTTYWSPNRLTISVSNHVLTGVSNANSYPYVSVYHQFPAGQLIQGHTYLQVIQARITSGNCSQFKFMFHSAGTKTILNPTVNTWYTLALIVENNVSNSSAVNALALERTYASTEDIAVGTDSMEVKAPQLFDLTLMFNGNIPTEIINGITNVGGVSGLNISGVAIFNSLFPEPYYAYGSQLVSSQASKLVNIGYNQFDGELEQGRYDLNTGLPAIGYEGYYRSKNKIRVICGQKYTLSRNENTLVYLYEYDVNNNFLGNTYLSTGTTNDITLKQNTAYINFALGSSLATEPTQVCFHLTWDSSRTGYEEYVKKEYDLPNEVLRSAGDVYDEIKPDGTKTVRVGTYTFTGSETFTDYSGSGVSLAMALSNAKTPSANNVVANMIWELGIVSSSNDINNSSLALGEYTVALSTSGYLYIRTTKNSSQLASALQGKTIQFELAEPTTSQVSTFAENVEVDDFGTMQFVSTYPQGNAFFYPADYVLFIDSLYNEVEGDVSNLALKTDLVVSALPSNSEDGTYTLKATKSGTTITYAWVLDE